MSLLGGSSPSLQLGDDMIKQNSSYVQLPGVTIAADLGLGLGLKCLQNMFLLAWLQQLRRVRRWPENKSV